VKRIDRDWLFVSLMTGWVPCQSGSSLLGLDGPESGELVLRHVDLRALGETGLAQRLAEEVGSVAVERLVTRGGPADRGIRDFVGFGELFLPSSFEGKR